MFSFKVQCRGANNGCGVDGAVWHPVDMRLASIYTYPIKGCRRIAHDRAFVEPVGLAGDRRWLIVGADGEAVTQREEPGLVRIRPSIVDGGLVLRAGAPEPAQAAGSPSPPDVPDLAVPEPVDGEPLPVSLWRDPFVARSAGPAADDWLATVLDRKVRLVWMEDLTQRPVEPRYAEPADRVGFADGYPLLVTNTASLDSLNGWLVESGSVEGPLPMTRFRPNLVVSLAEPWAEDGWLGGRLRIGDVTFRAPKPCDRCVVTTTDQETGERGHEPLRTLAKHRNVGQKLLFGMNLIPDGTGHVAVGDAVSPLE
jgi:uncharacterized protein YcbX